MTRDDWEGLGLMLLWTLIPFGIGVFIGAIAWAR